MEDRHLNSYLNHKDIIDQYIKKYPDLSLTKIAQKLAFDGMEYNPDYLRKLIAVAKNKVEDLDLEEPEFDLPESYYTEPEINVLYGSKNVLILNDIHIPFQDNNSLLKALNYGKNANIDTIYLNGDIVDMYGVSSFAKDPNYDNIWLEIKAARKFFETLRRNFPNQKIYYKFGNHEARLEKYIWNKATEFRDVPDLRLESLLKLFDYDITAISSDRISLLGKLYILHGDEFRVGGQGVFGARSLRLRANDNIIFGHFHKTQEDIITTIGGKQIGSWMVGWLCGSRPKYMPLNQWNQGFAHVIMDGDYFEVHNKKIIYGSIR